MAWNGYGLSEWKCKCGAARKVTGCMVKGEMMTEVYATPCKRCGTTEPPAVWAFDPWLYFEAEA